MGEFGQRGHVEHLAGLVVDVREHQHGGVGADGGVELGRRIDQSQRIALLQQVGQALGDIQVGREVAGLGHDHLARRVARLLHAQRRGQHLEQVDRGGVGHHHFILAGADQRGELVAQPLRQFEPAGGVPAADQAIAPFLGHHLGSARGGGARAGAERIAVEVDHALGQGELLAQGAQRVLLVELQTVLAVNGRHVLMVGMS
ncbi:hypothetical protein D3C72_1517280 [compost metagenome]